MARHVVERRTPPVTRVILIVLALTVYGISSRAQEVQDVSKVRAEKTAEAASTGAPEIPRVRSTDSTIRNLVEKASTLSTTFRGLIDNINATDGIVYVEPGRCGKNVRACLALTVQVAGPNRILRIVVDPRKPDCDLIASIGHELWHAIEVLREPSLTSDAALFFFYAREGRHGDRDSDPLGAWETQAAVKTGDAVRAELRNRAFDDAARCLATLSTPIPEVVGTHELQVLPRVRSHSPLITDAIAQGIERSTTFRRLVEAIDATDGLVYILEGKCGLGVRACLHMSLELSGTNRLLRVLVTPSRAPGCELIASIGHELQHALEVLGNRRIRTTAELFSFFHRIRPENPGRYETAKAVETGEAVDKEACSRSTNR